MKKVISFTDSGAVFSPDRVYRYHLWREWDATKPHIAWCMLNPSTADETNLDPTLRRCLAYSHAWGFGGFSVVNLFALRSTDPRGLYAVEDPIGPENDRHIVRVTNRCIRVIAGWGTEDIARTRSIEVAKLVDLGMWCLGENKDGSPKHPLYLRKDAEVKVWSGSSKR